MGVVDTEKLSSQALQWTNVLGHILLISSLIVALTSYWFQVSFEANPATVANPFSRGPFSCPAAVWEVYMFRGFCNQRRLVGAQRGPKDTKICISWNDENDWKAFDKANEVKSKFKDGRQAWMATAALMPCALLLALITLAVTVIPSLHSTGMLGTWSLILFFQFVLTFIAWLIALRSDQMIENKFDGLPGCGNAAGRVGPGFIFGVLASVTALGLCILNAMAARAFSYAGESKTTRRVEPRTTAPVVTTGPQEDRQVQGYRPDIVA